MSEEARWIDETHLASDALYRILMAVEQKAGYEVAIASLYQVFVGTLANMPQEAASDFISRLEGSIKEYHTARKETDDSKAQPN